MFKHSNPGEENININENAQGPFVVYAIVRKLLDPVDTESNSVSGEHKVVIGTTASGEAISGNTTLEEIVSYVITLLKLGRKDFTTICGLNYAVRKLSGTITHSVPVDDFNLRSVKLQLVPSTFDGAIECKEMFMYFSK
jgi:hypothetical protein